MYHIGKTFRRSFAHTRRCQALGIGRGGRNTGHSVDYRMAITCRW